MKKAADQELDPVPLFDSHLHCYPNWLNAQLPESLKIPAQFFRNQLRRKSEPLSQSLHKAHSMLPLLPQSVRRWIEETTPWVPAAHLLVESDSEDLLQAAQRTEELGRFQWKGGALIAHPPLISNLFVQELCSELNQKASQTFSQTVNWLSVWKLDPKDPSPAQSVAQAAEAGMAALKIHPAADGLSPDSPVYRSALIEAVSKGLPIILHTGCIHSHLIYKDPELGRPLQWRSWFQEFPNHPFVLAHMGMHEIQQVLDLMQEFPQIWTDTSWQPAEKIAEAVRQVGHQRILFGSDWPLLGGNLEVASDRLWDAFSSGWISQEALRAIASENASQLFSLSLSTKASAK